MPTPLPAVPLDAKTAWLIIGLLYVFMPLTVWTVIHGRHDARNSALWCVGAGLSGATLLLIGLRDALAAPWAVEVGNLLGYLGFSLRWSALRLERGARAQLAAALSVAAVATLVLAYFDAVGNRERLVYNAIANAGAALAIAREALRLARTHGSRSARMLGFTYALLAASQLLRAGSVALGWGAPVTLNFGVDTAMVVLSGILSALWGNIGYLGFAMEMAQRRVSARTAELAAATARGEVAERQAAELKALSDERQELLRVISHEVRQPLHNAQAVLQSVDRALHGELTDGEAAAARITRARAVLGQITASLDNTLAASTLLVGERPPSLRDTDIDMLLQLCLGDLPAAGRPRVQIVRETSVRTAAMDVGLMRLALRNLLNNALAYAGPGSPVRLRVADSDEPLALVLEVGDDGPGVPPELLPHLFERGTRGRHDLPGQGLGLYIVRQAMRRQGGTVEVASGPQGTRFTLAVPQGIEPE